MANFSVVLLTAAPPGPNEAGGAFVKIDGRECLLRSVELFLNRDNIKQIQLVASSDEMEEVRRKYAAHLGFSGVKLLAATEKWVDQLAAAAEKISAECSHVIVHDAARPIVPFNDIDAVLRQPPAHGAIALATPIRESLVEVEISGNTMGFCPPGRYSRLITPRVYSKDLFVQLAKSRQEISPADLKIITGSPLNVRVNSGADAGFAKAMLQMLPKSKMKASENPFEEAQW